MKVKAQPITVKDDGLMRRETWANGGELIHFGGETIYCSGKSPDGKRIWSKSMRGGIHNGAWKSEAVIRRQGKEWIWDVGEYGPIWVPHRV